MAVRLGAKDAGALLQHLDDVFVGVLDKDALELRHLRRETAVGVERADERVALADDAARDTDVVVLLAEGRRAVHHPRAAVLSHEGAGDDAEGAGVALGLEVVEGRRVLQALELLAGEALQLGELLERLLLLLLVVELGVELAHAHGHHHVGLARGLVAEFDILLLGVHTEREVRRESPWGGGPSQHARALREALVSAAQQRECTDNRRVVHILVVLLRLEVGEHGVARARIGHHFEAAVDEALVVQLLEDPPDRLHEGKVHRLVALVEIDPAADALDGLLPFLLVAHHNRPALGIVCGDAHLEHVIPPCDFLLLVNLVLDRQPVAVPAEAAWYVVASLVRVPAHNILNGASKDVAIVR
mmetsp:Transcript_3200/g.6702  ORF Transcript_3200/g.6702 Transcript_3200/m.6702 type:complete len:359 (-) Transcript_3200:191-1267(-)